MKIVKCEFVDPNENKDIKKKNGFSVDCDATIKNDDLSYYCSRQDIIQLIMKSYSERELISGKKKVTDSNLRYYFYVSIENSVKGCIIVDIPTAMLMMDNNAKEMKKILDRYQGSAADRRKRETIKNIVITAGGIAALLGFGKITADGIAKEIDAATDRNQKYYDDYVKYNKHYEGEIGYDDAFDYSVANDNYFIPNDCLEFTDSKVLKKTR